ncbi:pseudouridine synthase [Clostridium sp. AF18-27]|uniref:pseudouridine synthase n=1 Tax=Enterocloster lavalensis TaxID=460384 RepID=UPI000E4DDCCA|nr:pseudouridine synthase [Clostridium sp. AF18-27]
MMEERLNKLLSAMGVCSRREADRLIESGKVLVDGVPAKMGQKVRLDQTVVCRGKVVGRGETAAPGAGSGKVARGAGNRKVAQGARNGKSARGPELGKPAQGALRGKWDQGAESVRDNTAAPASSPRPMKKPRPVLLAVNKPKGVVCTASDKDKAPNIVDMIQYPVRVYYVGRLDKDSEGLVLMTNQGDLVNKIMRSGNAHEKEYQVVVDRPVTAEFLARMEKGVRLKELDRTTLPCKVRKTGDKRFSIVLTQGLNRQIRRMCEACGCHVRSLKRVRVMNICLGDLKSGEYRQVEGAEYREFMKLLEHSTNLSFRQQNAARGHDQSDGE